MTPEELSTLEDLGTDMLHGFAVIANKTVLLTIYAVLVLKATFILLSKERRGSKTHLMILANLLTMFSIAVVMWTLDLTSFIAEAKFTLIANPERSLADRLEGARNEFVFPFLAADAALYGYLSLLGDAIIIHRVWTLKAYWRVWIFFIPCAFLFVSSIATVLLTYCVAIAGDELVLGMFENPEFCRNVQVMTYVMPCLTTAVATLFISVTAWKHRKWSNILRENGLGPSGRSQTERILILLLDSGLLYFLFFAIQAMDSIPRLQTWIHSHSGISFLLTMFQYSTSVIVGIYPTMIVVLAHSQRKGTTCVDYRPSAGSSTPGGGIHATPNVHSRASFSSTRPLRPQTDESDVEAGLAVEKGVGAGAKPWV
ncbi:hypothetical protein FB45DRAFT_1138506 [Roridomyces roridus]|uniref:Uncharacterized protein n=1 Tax=Roridomyces roridus TaxID=1738132 RepID=A0AAD7C1L2_9AGAR|nr:hypothetical protein FB45DRAFT_1138506 [Roridomyces roridus]